MSKEENLARIIRNTNFDNVKRIVHEYLYKKYDDIHDDILISRFANEVLRGNFVNIAREDINELLNLLGHKSNSEKIIIDDNEYMVNEEVEKFETKTETEQTTAPKRRGRPPKSKQQKNSNESIAENKTETTLPVNEDILKQMEMLQLKIQELEERDKQKEKELKNLNEKIKVFKLTENDPVIVNDDDIDELNIQYLTNKIIEYGEAFVIEKDDRLIFPKTYFEIKK